MRHGFAAGLLATALAMGGCGRGEAGQGPQETRSFALVDFDRVTLGGSDNVKIVYGRNFAISATGPADVLDRLDVRKDGATLLITRKKQDGWKIGWNKKTSSATVTVTMPLLRAAMLSGAGNMTIATATPEDAFAATLSGSGDLSVDNSRAKAVDLSLTGAGNMTLRGTADTINARLTGSGNMDTVALSARDVTVGLSGAGNISASASESASGTLSGVGNIDIAGAARCAVRKSGVGHVRCGTARE